MEKPRFASPVARGGQNEGKRKSQVQKEDRIKKTREREDKESGEREREIIHASGIKESERGDVLEWSEKSEIGQGDRSTCVGPKQTKILESETENLSAKKMKGRKFTKAGVERTVKRVESEENLVVGNAEPRVVQKDGEGVTEWAEQDGETVNERTKVLERKKPILSRGAESAISVVKGSKAKKKDYAADVQDKEGVKKDESKNMRAEGKGGEKEKRRRKSVDSEQKAGKSRVQNSINSKDPKPISSLLSDSQYNEIFESVLDSSLEHCLEDARAVLNEVELLQASIDENCESSTVGGSKEGEHESSQPLKSSQKNAVRGKKRKLKKNRVEAVKDKNSGQQTHECKQEPESVNCHEDEYDLWAQCSRNNCKKWRKLKWHEDLSVLPADWVCSQNTDPQHSSCECPEEDWTDSEENLVLSSLVPGSMVWAQQPGFPWWPAMIEKDPDSKSSFLFKNHEDKSPSKYHVTYFGEPVTRAWVSAWRVMAFHALTEEAALSTVKQQSNKKAFSESLTMSRQAEKLPLKRRLAQFGFLSRYSNGRNISAEEDDTEGSGEYTYDAEDFDATPKKKCQKGAKPEAGKKAARQASDQKQNGKNWQKPNSNKECGEKKNKGKEGEKKKPMKSLFTGPKKKAASKPGSSVGEANFGGTELEIAMEETEENVFTPSFTKPKQKKTNAKQVLQVEKLQLEVREQAIQGSSDHRGQAGGEEKRGLGSKNENRKAGKIKGKEEGLRRDVQKEGSGEERKNKMRQVLKREGSAKKMDKRGSTGEREGVELEKECMKKTEIGPSEDLADFLDDDIEILNCQQGLFKDVGTDEEEDDEDFHLLQFNGVKATYVPV